MCRVARASIRYGTFRLVLVGSWLLLGPPTYIGRSQSRLAPSLMQQTLFHSVQFSMCSEFFYLSWIHLNRSKFYPSLIFRWCTRIHLPRCRSVFFVLFLQISRCRLTVSRNLRLCWISSANAGNVECTCVGLVKENFDVSV